MLLLLIVAVGTLSACGPLGDDDTEPTVPPAPDLADIETSIAASPSAATPVASPTAAIASPVASPTDLPAASPAAPPADAAAAEPPVATDCTPPDPLPPVEGGADRVVEEGDQGLNLRPGPGADCEPVVTIIPAGAAVTALSGPVAVDGDLWLNVEYETDQGWVAAEFIEPAE